LRRRARQAPSADKAEWNLRAIKSASAGVTLPSINALDTASATAPTSLDAIRKSVSQPDTAGETALERLKRLSARNAA
jgi:hypothetical protein